MTLRTAKTIAVSIDASARRVYEFASNPENFPKWAANFAKSITRSGKDWIVNASDGPIRCVFTPHNDFGVLDHYVYPRPDAEIYIPLRVIPNGSGSEVMFTLFRQPEMSDQSFVADEALVAEDLAALKRLMEA